MNPTESDLVRAAARGDPQAFGALLAKYQDVVYAVALSIVRDFHVAQDVAQEAFITAHQRLGTLREPEKFPGWLRRIAVNAARIRIRRQRAQPLAPVDAAERIHPKPGYGFRKQAPSHHATGDDFTRQVMSIVSSLSEKKRVPVLLCYMDSISRKEAAQFLGIRESTLRKRLHDAKAQLQREIVEFAEKTLQEYRLPRDFAKKCICGCERMNKEVKTMPKMKTKKAKKPSRVNANCRCGCIPLTKRAK